MPMLDFTFPADALAEPALEWLCNQMVIATHTEEGYLNSPFAKSISRVYLHALPRSAIRGAESVSEQRLYRIEISALKGTLERSQKKKLSEQLARLVLEAEQTPYSLDEAARIWCIFRDIEEGEWMSGRQVAKLAVHRKVVAEELARATGQ